MKTATARKRVAKVEPKSEAGGWVSSRAAAVALGVTRTKLLRFALQGELKAMEHGGRTWISEKSIGQLRDKLARATL